MTLHARRSGQRSPAIHQLLSVWLHVTAPATLSVARGPAAHHHHPLAARLEPDRLSRHGFAQRGRGLLSGIAGGYDQAWVWDNAQGRWLDFTPGDPANTLTHFHPGDAIWLHATWAGTVVIVN